MTDIARIVLPVLQAFVLLVALMIPSHARDAAKLPPLLDYFVKSIQMLVDEEKVSLQPAVGRITKTDTGYVAEEVVIAAVAEGTSIPVVHIARIEVDHPQEEDGLLTAKHMRFHDLRAEVRDPEKSTLDSTLALSIVIPDVILDDVSLLKKEAARNVMERINAGHVTAGSIVIPTLQMRFKGDKRLVVTGIRGGFSGDRRTGAGHSELDIGRVELPADAVAKLARKDALGGLGFVQFIFTGGFVLDTRWDEKQRAHYSTTVRLGMEGAGDLKVSLKDLRLPSEVLLTANEPGGDKRFEEAFNDPESQLGRIIRNDITLLGLSVGWMDKGLTEKLITQYMKKNGLTKEQVIEAWSAYPQSFLFVIGLPQVGMQASLALKEFLKNPQSLVISMEAKAPMNFSTLMTLLEDPKGLTESLNLKVIANGGGK